MYFVLCLSVHETRRNNPIQISEIQNAINSAHVSVFVEPSDALRLYSVTMPGEHSLMLGFEIISKYCKYAIEIDDTVFKQSYVAGRNVCCCSCHSG